MHSYCGPKQKTMELKLSGFEHTVKNSRSDEDDAQKFHVEDCIPILECWALLDHFLPPLGFCTLCMQKRIILQLSKGQSSHLVSMSCSCEV